MPPRKAVGSVHSARYRAFLKLLRQARLAARLTQAAVATALGRPQTFVAKCEAGERRVDVIELEQVAKLYGRSPSFFLPASKRG